MMASNAKESSLLFSNNITSPFDDLGSSAVLLPPLVTSQEISRSESSGSLSQSLQPHLASENKPTRFNPLQQSSQYSLSTSVSSTIPVSSQLKSLPPPKFPAVVDTGSSFLRKPATKYVAPSHVSTFVNAPSASQFVPTVTSNPFIPPSIVSNDSSALKFNPNHFGPGLMPVTQHHPSFSPYESSSTVIPASFDAMATNPPMAGEMYHAVMHHWFYNDTKSNGWKPFSFTDSLNLEEVYCQEKNEVVVTDGGHYDVDIAKRIRTPVYWEAPETSVRRCSWFRRTFTETYPVPYSEDSSQMLESVYKEAVISGEWHRQVELPGGERVMINSPHSMHHYQSVETADTQNIASISESQTPLTVRRGTDDFEIKDGASEQVDHLLFLIHGIGSVCDLRFRGVEECVDDFRVLGEELLSCHFKGAIDRGEIGRVDILPISWHKALHSDATGVDAKLKKITLRSIPKLRDFTNDTLLDILFYTSPVYCQHIMDTVASEMERLLALFRDRHPEFDGSVSVGGHSLGSVILFDLLMHQRPVTNDEVSNPEKITTDKVEALGSCNRLSDEELPPKSTSQINFEMGVAGTGQPAIIYPQLNFKPKAFFLMGSPVGMFITVRGIEKLGPDFKLPTCDHVYNIFHPFDPVAYRIETLIDNSCEQLRPVLIPHHKGRKRMHLELKDTIERVGSDIKNKIFDSLSATWNKFYQIYSGNPNQEEVQKEVDQAFQEQMERMSIEEDEASEADVRVGQLNRGERIDYVLQEKPYETFTEYIFALQAHLTYWSSEDTMLMILKELYKMKGILSDAQNDEDHNDLMSRTSSFQSASEISTQESNAPPLENIAPSAPIPLLSTSAVQSSLGPPPQSLPGMSFSKPKQLRGRPVFDPFKAPMTTMGMDPTASPSSDTALPPPPIVANVNFNRPPK